MIARRARSQCGSCNVSQGRPLCVISTEQSVPPLGGPGGNHFPWWGV